MSREPSSLEEGVWLREEGREGGAHQHLHSQCSWQREERSARRERGSTNLSEEEGTRERGWLTPLGSFVARERVAFDAILFLQSINRNMALMLGSERQWLQSHTHTQSLRRKRERVPNSSHDAHDHSSLHDTALWSERDNSGLRQWTMANLLECVRQAQNAGSDEGDEDVGKDLDATVRAFIVHLGRNNPTALDADSAVRFNWGKSLS